MIKHIFLKAVLIAFFLIMGVVLIKPTQSFSQNTPSEAEARTAAFLATTEACTDGYDACLDGCAGDESQEAETSCVENCTLGFGSCMSGF